MSLTIQPISRAQPLSLEQAKGILEGKKLKGINRDDEKELLNYKKAMDFISKYLGKDDPITGNLQKNKGHA